MTDVIWRGRSSIKPLVFLVAIFASHISINHISSQLNFIVVIIIIAVHSIFIWIVVNIVVVAAIIIIANIIVVVGRGSGSGCDGGGPLNAIAIGKLTIL